MGVQLSIGGTGVQAFTLELDKFHDRVVDARPAFEEMARQGVLSLQLQFQTQGTHYGSRWAPLSPAYAAWKRKHYGRKPILQLTGALIGSLGNGPGGIHEVTARGMSVGTAIPYAKWHQRGTPHMPARPIVGESTSTDAKTYAKIMQAWLVKGTVNA